MSMFLLKSSSHRSCNLASECTHVCWLVWVGVCTFLCVGWYVPPEVRVDCCALCVRVRVHVCARQPVLFDRQSPLEYAFATVSRPSMPKVTTLPRKIADVQKRAPLAPEPSRARPCHGFTPLDAKSDDRSTQNRGRPKASPLAPEPSRARRCHGFAPLEAKSDDPSTQNRGRPKARAASARALQSTPLPRFHAPRCQK